MTRFSRRCLPLSSLFVLLLSGAAVARDKPRLDAFAAAAPHPAAPRAHAAAVVASVDEKRNAPTFLWADRAASRSSAPTFEAAAREHLTRHASRWGLGPAALATAEVAGVHDIGRGGVLVAFRQRVSGVEVFHHDLKVLMDRERSLVAIGGSLHEGAVPSAKLGAHVLSPAAALGRALSDLYDTAVARSDLEDRGAVPGGYRAFALAATPAVATLGFRLSSPQRVKPVYYPLPDRLVAAYFVEVDAREDGSRDLDAYAYVVAADDGRVLHRVTLTHAATFGYRVWADETGDHRPKDGPLADFTPYPGTMPMGTYPDGAPPSMIAMDGFNQPKDPWLPEGATESSGNNVDAYTDDDDPDGFSPGDLRASVTSPGTFDRVYTLGTSPSASPDQRMAAVTSIFYTTNWLHDWWYDSGFDEKAHNGQKSNYGRGGVEGDPLLAEAQNGAPGERNNANMSPFEDGKSPRMQMFVWDEVGGTATVTLSPSGKAFDGGVPDFGPTNYDLSAEVALVDDGTAPINDACQPIIGDVKGKIALIQRGSCKFAEKSQAAEKAGAAAVIIFDNTASATPPGMSGDPAITVSIPVLSITQANGKTLSGLLATGPVTAKMARYSPPDRDGTIDNTVVAHEWGHYLHLRSVACASQACFAESEGWGDFNALMMVVRKGDALDGIYPITQYASRALSTDPGYFGIRRYPYSVDFAKNALTFKHITSGQALPAGIPVSAKVANDNAEVHAAGEVWASMMFEAYVALLSRSQGASPAYSFDEARRRMSDYVVLGMKLAPTDPTYTEQRDAILAAAAASDDADVQAIAKAFARRGAGTCAVSPPRDSNDFAGVVESFEIGPGASVHSVTVDDSVTSCDHDGNLDAGESGKVTITVKNLGAAPLAGATLKVTTTSPAVTFPSGASVPLADIPAFGSAQALVDVALAASVLGIQTADLSVTLENATACAGSGSLTASPRVNFDQATTGAVLDTVEATTTTWTTTGDAADKIWSRLEVSPGSHVWAGVDYASPSDTALVSPPLTVSNAAPLVLSFKHRHQFEAQNGVNYDGAVIELSADGGASWVDVSTFADPGYSGTIGDPMNQASNPLKDRPGFVDHNPSFPMMDAVTLDLGTSLAGKTVQIRFRIGTDDASGNLGWQLDDLGLTGITNAPFSAIVDDPSACQGLTPAPTGSDYHDVGGGGSPASVAATPVTPEVSGGGCQLSTAPNGPASSLAAGLVALAALFARRRRR